MEYTASEQRYETMKYRRVGKSGLLFPILSLGFWHNFGTNDNYENMKAMCFTAFDHGVTQFDLANNYGPEYGSAESNLGRIMREELHAYRDELLITTKAGFDMWPGPYGDHGSRKYLIASLDQSLKRMGLEYVDIFYHHRMDPDTPLEETMGALASAVQSGKAIYVGLSNYKEEETRKAVKILKENGTPCLIHQPRYNMLERWVEDGLLSALDENGVGCICFSPLAQGALTDKYLKGIPAGSRASREGTTVAQRYLSDEQLGKIKQLNQLAEERGQTLAQMAIAWILRRPEVTTVLVGASRVSQLDNSLAALECTGFSENELKKIDEILA